MITIEEAGDMLDDIADSLPEDFFKRLNGGIILFPEEKLHPKNRSNDLFILGEYHNEHYLGRYIIIYYGSFIRVYGSLSPEQSKERLRKILVHEFTHHLESLAGERDLEVQDAIDLMKYEKRYVRRPIPSE